MAIEQYNLLPIYLLTYPGTYYNTNTTPAYLHVALLCCHVRGCCPIFVGDVDVPTGTKRDQRLNHTHVTLGRADPDARP